MERIQLTFSEWNVLSCLWEKSPQTVMQLVSRLGEEVGWAKSTTLTTLRRMEEKGLLSYELQGRAKLFRAAVRREDVVAAETESLLSRAYHGSVGLLVNALAEQQQLSRSDIEELYAILRKAEEGTK